MMLQVELDPKPILDSGVTIVQHFRDKAYYDRIAGKLDDLSLPALHDKPAVPPVALADAPADEGDEVEPSGSDESDHADRPAADDGDAAAPEGVPADESKDGMAGGDIAGADGIMVGGLDAVAVGEDHFVAWVQHIGGLVGLEDVVGKTIHYGAFSISYKVQRDNSRSWQCACPWHRKNTVTGCVTTVSLPWDAEPAEHIAVVRRLMHWARNGRAYTRQWQHRGFRPEIAECPDIPFMVHDAPTSLPPGRVATDPELDALDAASGAAAAPAPASSVAAPSVASSAGRGRGRGRGRARGRASGRAAGRAAGRAGGPSHSESDAAGAEEGSSGSEACSTGSGLNSVGPDSSDSEQMRAKGLVRPPPVPEAPMPESSSDSSSSGSDSD